MNFKRRIAIVDGDKVLLDSYSHVINASDKFVTIGAYSTAEEAFSELIRKKVEIVIMEIQLGGVIDGISATEKIRSKYPHIDIIIHTSLDELEHVKNVFKAGASGYILKSSNCLQIVEALNVLSNGGAPIDPKIARLLVGQFHVNVNSPLSRREREVLMLMSSGKSYMQMADVLFVSPKTARTHIRNIYNKLQVSSKAEAIRVATDNHFV